MICVWLDGGAFLASGIVLMMVGARDSVFVARNSAILKRYAPGVRGSLPGLRTHILPDMQALSAFSMAWMKVR